VRPQGFFPVRYDADAGKWFGKVVGGPANSFKRIIAAVAPPTSHEFFQYFQKVGDATGKWEPFERVPLECTKRTYVVAQLP
jgi:hypothetical protein